MSEENSFGQFKLNPQLLKALVALGFFTPTDIQRKAIPVIQSGQEVIGIAQTGTGKTAAYLIPALMKTRYAQGTDPRVIILAPSKELVVQIHDHAKALAQFTDLRIVALYGGVGPKAQIEILKQGTDIVVATPGRLMELYLKKELNVRQIKMLIIDEADRLMDMGFMPQLRKIFEVVPVKRQNLLFSATFPPKVEKLSEEFLEFPVKIEITPQATPAAKVQQSLYYVPNFQTKINLLEYLLRDREKVKRAIVFVRTKEAANNIFKYINRKQLGPVKVIHSNKGQNARLNAMQEFGTGQFRILVSTDVAARGIDISGITHVFNFDVPLHHEDYVHRIGRTGRAFNEGSAFTFVHPGEVYHLEKIENLIREKIPVHEIPSEVVIEETGRAEKRHIAMQLDNQRKKEDPEFKGAFHEKKLRK